MLGVTCLQEAQSFVCLSHLLSSWSLLSLGGRSAEVAPFAQPTSPPAFSCSHTLKAATALHTSQPLNQLLFTSHAYSCKLQAFVKADSYPAAFYRQCIQLLKADSYLFAFARPCIQLQAFMKADSYPLAFAWPCIQLQAFVKAEHIQPSLKGHAYSCKLLGSRGRTCSAVFEWPCIQLRATMKANSYPVEKTSIKPQLVKTEHIQLLLEGHAYS